MGLVTESFDANGTQKTFTIGNDILSDSHCRIHFYYDGVDGLADYLTSSSEWDLLGKSTVVFNEAPTNGYVIKVTTSSDGTLLDSAPSEISVVTSNIEDVLTVAYSIDGINTVADELNTTEVLETISADLLLGVDGNIGKVNANKTNIDTVAGDTNAINNVNNSLSNVGTVSTNINSVNTNANSISSIVTVANALNSGLGTGTSSGGQYHGNGIIKGVEYFSKYGTSTDSIIITTGTNAISVDSFTIANGGSITIENDSIYKVI